MDYVEIHVKVNPRNPFSDLLIHAMGEVGFESFVDTEDGFLAYIPETAYTPGLEKSCWAWQTEGATISATQKIIARKNWNAAWEENFKPILVDEQVYIYAPFHPQKPAVAFQIEIEPKMSFGTGHHETTHLMVQHILGVNCQNKRVLDMGCGTGILAILAAQKGAKPVVAIDIDDWSIENTRENATRNSVPLETRLGGAEQLQNEKFDIIFANINLNILLADMVSYAAVLAKNGEIIFSGFYKSDYPILQAEAEKYGLIAGATKTKNNWMAAHFKREN